MKLLRFIDDLFTFVMTIFLSLIIAAGMFIVLAWLGLTLLGVAEVIFPS